MFIVQVTNKYGTFPELLTDDFTKALHFAEHIDVQAFGITGNSGERVAIYDLTPDQPLHDKPSEFYKHSASAPDCILKPSRAPDDGTGAQKIIWEVRFSDPHREAAHKALQRRLAASGQP